MSESADLYAKHWRAGTLRQLVAELVAERDALLRVLDARRVVGTGDKLVGHSVPLESQLPAVQCCGAFLTFRLSVTTGIWVARCGTCGKVFGPHVDNVIHPLDMRDPIPGGQYPEIRSGKP